VAGNRAAGARRGKPRVLPVGVNLLSTLCRLGNGALGEDKLRPYVRPSVFAEVSRANTRFAPTKPPMRLFTAIELPAPVRNHLAGLAREWAENWGEELPGLSNGEYPRASWVRPENLHVTLKFLGEVPEPDVPRVCEALSDCASPRPMRLNVDYIECLPPRGPVRVIAAGVGGDVGRLILLHREIEDACGRIGFAPESREYRPHITLARAKVPLPRHVRESLSAAGGRHVPGPAFDVRESVLMESRLRPQGAEYLPVARFPLGTAGA
jgi:RNA 2',3'-cyclic 3'-phosphodiesterase